MSETATWTPVHLSVRKPASRPADFHLIDGDLPLVWLVGGSQLFQVDPPFFHALQAGDDRAVAEVGALAGPLNDLPVDIEDEPRAVSLALAQACNLSCSYCYASGGTFGGPPQRMSAAIARRAVDGLVAGAAGRPVTLGFIGGEVLLHRDLLHDIVRYAQAAAEAARVAIRYSITTNGTLLKPEDVRLFRRYGFTVTVSLDGGRSTNDRHRSTHRGGGSFDAAVAGVSSLLAEPGRAKVAARVTVARDDLRVHERIQGLAGVGFREIGVSPLRTGPDRAARFAPEDWEPFLAEMVRAADAEVERISEGHVPRFTNLVNAVREIHRGSRRPLPCGSAGDYVAVGSQGDYFSCHRTVDDPSYRLGNVHDGLSRSQRRAFVEARAVDRQEPCRGCWARYLCGGGCHAEVGEIGREGCDYIRGWLEHCMHIYAACSQDAPQVLEAMGVAR